MPKKRAPKKPARKKRTRVSRRNPVAPAARALTPRIKPSGKVYRRKPKHEATKPDNGVDS